MLILYSYDRRSAMADDLVSGPGHDPLDIARQAELLELTQDAILVRDLSSSAVTYWNRGAERLYGWQRQAALGQVTHTLLQTRFPASLEALDAALMARGYWEGELVHSRQDGSLVTVSSRQAVQCDTHGLPVAILEINTDISERKRAEEEQIGLAAERRARQLAERALDRLSRLQRVTAGLAEALTPAEVAQVVVQHGIAAFGARAGRIVVARPATRSLEVLAYAGYTHVRSRVSLDEHLPSTEVYRTERPLFVDTWAEMKARFPDLRDVAEPLFEGALASVPVVVDGRVHGAMTLSFDADRTFQVEDRELLRALATQCAQALERARLYELSLLIQADLRRSRDQLTAILGGIAEGVTVQDGDGQVVYANDIAARMAGFASADELIRAFPDSEARFSMLDADGNQLSFDDLPGRRLLRGLPANALEIQIRSAATGDARWTHLESTPVRDERGRLHLVVNIFRDVTDRKRQTEAAEFLAAASTILGSTLDADVSLQQVAQLAVPRLADWCMVDVLEQDNQRRRVAVAHVHAEDAEFARAFRERLPGVNTGGGLVGRALRTGRGELIAEASAGAEVAASSDPETRRLIELMQPRSWIVVPLVARGHTFGTITFATAASGRRYGQSDFKLAEDLAVRVALAIDNARLFHEAQEQARQQGSLNVVLRETVEERDHALADLQQALRTRDEFLASASHDLKNPLASVKATSQLLARRLDRSAPLDIDRMRDGLHRLDAIATRAAGLVDELLDLARVEMGQPLDLDPHPTDLVKLAREVADEHQQATERHEIRVRSAQPELIGMWDSRLLGRMLSNLLDNAVKYSPDGGPVGVMLRTESDWAVLEVSDAGIGIPQADQQRIFERFQRASNVERRIGGTGIGLASACHIVESHGGNIEVHSREGSGSTFIVRLPIALESAPGRLEGDAGERS